MLAILAMLSDIPLYISAIFEKLIEVIGQLF